MRDDESRRVVVVPSASMSRRVRGGEHVGDAKKRERTEAPVRGRGRGAGRGNGIRIERKTLKLKEPK